MCNCVEWRRNKGAGRGAEGSGVWCGEKWSGLGGQPLVLPDVWLTIGRQHKRTRGNMYVRTEKRVDGRA